VAAFPISFFGYLGEDLVEAFVSGRPHHFAGHRQTVLAGYFRVHTGVDRMAFNHILDEWG